MFIKFVAKESVYHEEQNKPIYIFKNVGGLTKTEKKNIFTKKYLMFSLADYQWDALALYTVIHISISLMAVFSRIAIHHPRWGLCHHLGIYR